MAFGYFNSAQAWIYLGLAITLGGVLMEVFFGIIGVKANMTVR
jgi:hypothetical protein